MTPWTTDWIENRLRPWLLDRLKAVSRKEYEELRARLFRAFRENDDLAKKLEASEESLIALADQYRAEQKLFEDDPAAFERALWVPSIWTKAQTDPEEFLSGHMLRMSAGITAGQSVVLTSSDLRAMDATAMARLWTTQIANAIRRRLFGQTLRQIAKLKGTRDGGTQGENPL